MSWIQQSSVQHLIEDMTDHKLPELEVQVDEFAVVGNEETKIKTPPL